MQTESATSQRKPTTTPLTITGSYVWKVFEQRFVVNLEGAETSGGSLPSVGDFVRNEASVVGAGTYCRNGGIGAGHAPGNQTSPDPVVVKKGIGILLPPLESLSRAGSRSQEKLTHAEGGYGVPRWVRAPKRFFKGGQETG